MLFICSVVQYVTRGKHVEAKWVGYQVEGEDVYCLFSCITFGKSFLANFNVPFKENIRL